MRNIRSFTDISESSKYIKEPTKCPRCGGSGLSGGSSDESVVKDFMKDYKMSKNASEFMTGILSSENEAFFNALKRHFTKMGIQSKEGLAVFKSLNVTKDEIRKTIDSSEEGLASAEVFVKMNSNGTRHTDSKIVEEAKEFINNMPEIISSLKRML
jgi:hypothetical protein